MTPAEMRAASTHQHIAEISPVPRRQGGARDRAAHADSYGDRVGGHLRVSRGDGPHARGRPNLLWAWQMTIEQQLEIEASEMLLDLAVKMEYVAIRMKNMLKHSPEAKVHSAELRGASSQVRQWGDRLK
jgi:hypothetical protein